MESDKQLSTLYEVRPRKDHRGVVQIAIAMLALATAQADVTVPVPEPQFRQGLINRLAKSASRLKRRTTTPCCS
jgi:hypothetical protein